MQCRKWIKLIWIWIAFTYDRIRSSIRVQHILHLCGGRWIASTHIWIMHAMHSAHSCTWRAARHVIEDRLIDSETPLLIRHNYHFYRYEAKARMSHKFLMGVRSIASHQYIYTFNFVVRLQNAYSRWLFGVKVYNFQSLLPIVVVNAMSFNGAVVLITGASSGIVPMRPIINERNDQPVW